MTTTNAMPMKITKIMYLHNAFHLAKNSGVTHMSKESVI